MLLDVLTLTSGIALILLVLHDIFQSVVVPRWSSRRFRIAPFLSDRLWRLWRRLADRKTDPEAREDFLGAFAPTALMTLLGVWVGLLIFGYGLCFWALRIQEKPAPTTLWEAIYIGGVTLLTIGFGDFAPIGAATRFVALSAGASGLVTFALVISFLFTLYATFERREVLILTLDARAGNPPSGVSLLQSFAELDLIGDLPRFFDKWEEWSAQVLQSHIAYPILPFFRSHHQGESWIAALGAVLDAATLLNTTIITDGKCEKRTLGAAVVMFRIGTHTIIDLSHYFGYRRDEDTDPHPYVERLEFIRARQLLEIAGYALRDEEDSWQKFRAGRARYAASLNELSKHFAAPPSQWIGDRSMIGSSPHRRVEKEALPNK